MKVKYHFLVLLLAGAVIAIMILLMTVASTKNSLRSTQFKPMMTSANSLEVRTQVLQTSDFNLTMIKSSLKKKGYSLTDLPPWSALWTDKIHLCVMFNLNGIKPTKDVTDILISYYYPFFKDITFIFDGVNWERPHFLPWFVNLISCNSFYGWYQHKCIRLCMQQGTEETEGYLYVADDMFVNLTMMSNLPTKKLWFTKMFEKSFSWILDPGPQGWGWQWWGPPYNNKDKLKHVVDTLPREWMEQLKRTGGFPEHFKIVATSDIIYVPQGLKQKLTNVIDFIADKEDLFDEIATCLAVNIAAPNQFIILKYGYLWSSVEKSVEGIKRKAKTAHFVHPVKLGMEQQRKLWIQYMEVQLYNSISRV